MKIEWELQDDEANSLTGIEDILRELEVLKKIHLQAIFAKAGSEAAGDDGLDEGRMKQVASYLKLVEKMVHIIEKRDRLRKSLLAEDAPLNVVVQVMREIPVLKEALERTDVQEKIIRVIRQKLEGKDVDEERGNSETAENEKTEAEKITGMQDQ